MDDDKHYLCEVNVLVQLQTWRLNLVHSQQVNADSNRIRYKYDRNGLRPQQLDK